MSEPPAKSDSAFSPPGIPHFEVSRVEALVLYAESAIFLQSVHKQGGGQGAHAGCGPIVT